MQRQQPHAPHHVQFAASPAVHYLDSPGSLTRGFEDGYGYGVGTGAALRGPYDQRQLSGMVGHGKSLFPTSDTTQNTNGQYTMYGMQQHAPPEMGVSMSMPPAVRNRGTMPSPYNTTMQGSGYPASPNMHMPYGNMPGSGYGSPPGMMPGMPPNMVPMRRRRSRSGMQSPRSFPPPSPYGGFEPNIPVWPADIPMPTKEIFANARFADHRDQILAESRVIGFQLDKTGFDLWSLLWTSTSELHTMQVQPTGTVEVSSASGDDLMTMDIYQRVRRCYSLNRKYFVFVVRRAAEDTGSASRVSASTTVRNGSRRSTATKTVQPSPTVSHASCQQMAPDGHVHASSRGVSGGESDGASGGKPDGASGGEPGGASDGKPGRVSDGKPGAGSGIRITVNSVPIPIPKNAHSVSATIRDPVGHGNSIVTVRSKSVPTGNEEGQPQSAVNTAEFSRAVGAAVGAAFDSARPLGFTHAPADGVSVSGTKKVGANSTRSDRGETEPAHREPTDWAKVFGNDADLATAAERYVAATRGTHQVALPEMA